MRANVNSYSFGHATKWHAQHFYDDHGFEGGGRGIYTRYSANGKHFNASMGVSTHRRATASWMQAPERELESPGVGGLLRSGLLPASVMSLVANGVLGPPLVTCCAGRALKVRVP